MCDAAGDGGGCGADTEPPRRRRAPGDRCESSPASEWTPVPLPVPPGIPPGIPPVHPQRAHQHPPVPPGVPPVLPQYLASVPRGCLWCYLRYPPNALSDPPVSPGNIPGIPGAARGPGPGPGVPGDRPCPRSHPRTCMKCGQGTAALVIRVGDPFCRGCFRDYFVHKFRAMLGKNRVIFPGEKVLLAVSGGPASSAMVRQVQEGLSREAAKRLRFVPGLVYVEEGAVRRQSPEQREQTLAQMETLLQATGFPYYLIHLEQVLG
ncbi:hypothetical protein Nmel_012071 [Mimus melanotis]